MRTRFDHEQGHGEVAGVEESVRRILEAEDDAQEEDADVHREPRLNNVWIWNRNSKFKSRHSFDSFCFWKKNNMSRDEISNFRFDIDENFAFNFRTR